MNNPERNNSLSGKMTAAWDTMVKQGEVDFYSSMSETQMEKALSGDIEDHSSITKYLQALRDYLDGNLEF